MRTIENTGQFKRDYKREAKGKHRATLDADLVPVLEALRMICPWNLHHDHALIGEWKDHRDCHIKPDLVLIYQVPDPLYPASCPPGLTFRNRVVTFSPHAE